MFSLGKTPARRFVHCVSLATLAVAPAPVALAVLTPTLAGQGAAAEKPAAPASERRDRVFSFRGRDGTELEAKLSLPAGRVGPLPVVFYLHGAGPRSFDNPFRYVDADGKPQTGNYLDYHAGELARRGIAFCRISKRGCKAADSPPRVKLDKDVFAKATPSVLLDDYERGLDALRKQPEIDPDRIVLMGSSEGTWVAPRLAKKSPAGIAGVVMMGYAADNTRDTVVWQHTVGPWRGIQHLMPAARDGKLTKVEYDAAVATRPELKAQLPFASLDADRDGALTQKDLERALAPKLAAILEAVRKGDDEFLQENLMNLSSAYLREWWVDKPNASYLLELEMPMRIFHGALDNTCRAEGVREAEVAFRKAGKGNLGVRIYPEAGHDLNWSLTEARKGGPEAYRDAFRAIAELVYPKVRR